MDINSQIYVDKTGLIKHTNRLIGSQQRFICVSRPRRFGKSMAANMLAAYYGKGCDSRQLFGQYKIARDETYEKHINLYNVIMLNMQDFFGLVPDVEDALGLLAGRVLKELKKCFPDSVDSGEEYLSLALEEIYSSTREPFIFIVDEWDCLLRDKGYEAAQQKRYLDFIRNLFKDKPYAGLVYMTGILPVKKYGTHSALNMFTEYSMTDPRFFGEFAGFTGQEVRELCSQYRRDYAEMELWYDGYTFADAPHIYNPKSVVEALLAGRCSNYWTQTETFEALKVYIRMDYDGLREAVARMLAGQGLKINIRSFQNDMETFESRDDVLTLLIHLGYLAFDQKKGEVFIPNKEIRDEFEVAIRSCKWREVTGALEKSERILQATWNMEEEKVADLLAQIHRENTSVLTYNDENSLSCVIALAYYSAQNEYVRIREFPAGEGFADLVFLPRRESRKPALVVELKYNKSAEGAIAQIKRRKYTEILSEYKGNILLVGINYQKDTKVHECKIEKFDK